MKSYLGYLMIWLNISLFLAIAIYWLELYAIRLWILLRHLQQYFALRYTNWTMLNAHSSNREITSVEMLYLLADISQCRRWWLFYEFCFTRLFWFVHDQSSTAADSLKLLLLIWTTFDVKLNRDLGNHLGHCNPLSFFSFSFLLRKPRPVWVRWRLSQRSNVIRSPYSIKLVVYCIELNG